MDLLIKVFKSFRADTDGCPVRKLLIPIRNILLSYVADLGIGNVEGGTDLQQTHFFINIEALKQLGILSSTVGRPLL